LYFIYLHDCSTSSHHNCILVSGKEERERERHSYLGKYFIEVAPAASLFIPLAKGLVTWLYLAAGEAGECFLCSRYSL
jgi:hypothetical protein